MNAHAPPSAPADATPVMAQFFEAKARQPDALVFFRMGDFYELFFEDAVKAAGALGIALTARGKHAGQDIPMAGVLAAGGQRNAQRARRLHRVLEEQLVEVAHAEEHQRVGLARLGLEELGHHRRGVGRGGGGCMGVHGAGDASGSPSESLAGPCVLPPLIPVKAEIQDRSAHG